jgi:alpha-L-fucosidase
MTSCCRFRMSAIALALCLVPLALYADGGGDSNPGLRPHAGALKRWQEMRFGMFIHWGPVTLRGTEIGWSRGREVPIEDYDSLYREFNPVLFNAPEWVAVAREAGMKYLVITTKHHDGFTLWPSEYSDYTIAATPFRRDVLRELSNACRAQGIMFGTYYSILDWHHPDYTTRYGGDPRPVDLSDMNRYRAYLKGQVRELVEKYQTNILWYDGEWEASWSHKDGMDLYAYGRQLKDSLLINNRVDNLRNGMQGMSSSDSAAGDFGTPEQVIGSFDLEHPWESNITICTQWAWKPNDRVKSLRECLHAMAKIAGGGGNFLLNISPMPDGRIERRTVKRLREIGRWLTANGEAIYGTTGGPYRPTSWITSTRKGNIIYVHLLGRLSDTLSLPAPGVRKVKSVSFLGGKALAFRALGRQVEIALPRTLPDNNDCVVSLVLDGSAAEVEPITVPVQAVMTHENIRLAHPALPPYDAGGEIALIDKLRGTLDYRDGRWIGAEGDDIEATLEFDRSKEIREITVGSLSRQDAWIFLPMTVEVEVSPDGKAWTPAGKTDLPVPTAAEPQAVKDVIVSFTPVKAKSIRVRVISPKVCPPWHIGNGGKAWVFVDEIGVR